MDNIHVKSCTKIFSAIKTSLMTPPAFYISTNSRHSHHESVQWCTRIWAAWGRKSRTSPRRDSARLREMFSYKDKDTSQVVKQTHKETLEHTHIHTHTLLLFVSPSLSLQKAPAGRPLSSLFPAEALGLEHCPWSTWTWLTSKIEQFAVTIPHTHLPPAVLSYKEERSSQANNSKEWHFVSCNISSIEMNLRAIFARLEAQSTDVEHYCNRWTGESCDRVGSPYVGGQTAGPVVFWRPAISMCFGLTHGQEGRSHFSCSWFELRKTMTCLSLDICRV